MARIDAYNPLVTHIGDNRHSPLKIAATGFPHFIQRDQEAQKAEVNHPMFAKGKAGNLVKRAREQLNRMTRR